MGTNYFVKAQPPCPTCEREYEDVHIGKSSYGWAFSLRVHRDLGLIDLHDWIEYLQRSSTVIVDEYGEELGFVEMLLIILDRKNVKLRRWANEDGRVTNGGGTYDLVEGDFS